MNNQRQPGARNPLSEAQYSNNDTDIKTIKCRSEKSETEYIYIVCIMLGIVVIIMLLIMTSIIKYYKIVRKERYRYLVRTVEFTGLDTIRTRGEIALTRL